MASFFNLILDTIAPVGLALSLNDGAHYTTSRDITAAITLSDAETTGYQMKIWGITDVEDEASAVWETFAASKALKLTDGDELKTVHIKVRDDVGNETAEVTATITLNTVVPVVSITGPDKTKISKVNTFDTAAFEEYIIRVVPSGSSLHDAGVAIPTTGGSTNTSGNEGGYAAKTPIEVTIKGADLEAASAGDGTKVVKVFVKNVAGTWSVA